MPQATFFSLTILGKNRPFLGVSKFHPNGACEKTSLSQGILYLLATFYKKTLI